MTLSDNDLLKYADGLLDADTCADVERLLQADKVAQERLRLIRLSGEALHREAAIGATISCDDPLACAILTGELDNGASARTESTSAVRNHSYRLGRLASGWGAIAASLLLLWAGAAAGYLVHGLSQKQIAQDVLSYPTWLVRVIDYHTLYDRETLAPAAARPDEIKTLATRFSAVLSRPVVIPELAGEQLEFKRGQFLKFEGNPIIQLAYLPYKTGRPVALCLKQTSKADTSLNYARVRGLGMVRWRQKGLEYVLVGDHSKDRLLEAARNARRQIRLASRT